MSNRAIASLLAAVLLSFGITACDHDDDEGPEPSDTGLPTVPPATYSIGGTVTGSTGPLTLHNSNGATLVVPASGAFTFATQVSSGTSYTVTVPIPPPSQSCTVANGSGSALAHVTNIAVTCTDNPFTLGGTLSGLDSGKSVTLRALTDAMTGDITLSSNGVFTFPQAFVNNAEYIVLVLTQPVNQICTVENEEGDISGGNVTSLAVACIDSSASARNWGTASAVALDGDPQDVNTFRTPVVGVDAAGNALALWEQDRVGAMGSDIYSSRRAAGSNWSAPVAIPSLFAPPMSESSGTTSRKPQLAVAANGNAVAVWVETGYHVWASFYTPASGWATSEPVYFNEGLGAGGTINPTVAIDASGNVLVVWENNIFGAPQHILYKRYSPGTGWTGPTNLARLVTDVQFGGREPELAMRPDGSAIAMWQQTDAGPFNHSQLWSSRYDMAADIWTAPQEVDSRDSGNPFYGRIIIGKKSVVLDQDGVATALWSQYDGTRMHVLFNRQTGNTWGTPAIVETGNDSGLSSAYDVRASIDGSGDIVAMWLQIDEEEGHYVANRYVPGSGWGTQSNIGEYVRVGHVASDTDFDLASNAAGDTVAVWTLVSGIGAENVPYPVYVSANEYNAATNAWGAEEVIDRVAQFPGEVEGDASKPAVAIDPQGDATAVWLQVNSGTQDGVRVNRFE